MPLPELLHVPKLEATLAQFRRAIGTKDRPAAASLWSQHYLLTLLPPIIASALSNCAKPDPAIATAKVLLSDDARPFAFCLPEMQPDSCSRSASWLSRLLLDHLSPFTLAMTQAGLSERVVWSNAAHVFDWTLKVVSVEPETLAAVVAALSDQRGRGHFENPMARYFQAISTRGVRPICCMRNMVRGLSRCMNCPQLKQHRCSRSHTEEAQSTKPSAPDMSAIPIR